MGIKLELCAELGCGRPSPGLSPLLCRGWKPLAALNRKLASHQSFGDAIWLEASQRPVPGKSTRKEALTLDCSHGTIIERMGRCDMSLEDHRQREVKDDPGAESRKLNVKNYL